MSEALPTNSTKAPLNPMLQATARRHAVRRCRGRAHGDHPLPSLHMAPGTATGRLLPDPSGRREGQEQPVLVLPAPGYRSLRARAWTQGKLPSAVKIGFWRFFLVPTMPHGHSDEKSCCVEWTSVIRPYLMNVRGL